MFIEKFLRKAAVVKGIYKGRRVSRASTRKTIVQIATGWDRLKQWFFIVSGVENWLRRQLRSVEE